MAEEALVDAANGDRTGTIWTPAGVCTRIRFGAVHLHAILGFRRVCGIAGFVGPGPEKLPVIRAMTSVLEHRGPDDEGYFCNEHVALGFRRLAIIDLKTGHQPMSTPDQTFWIVFNGEVYNYRELRRELEMAGSVFRTESDTEVVLESYRRWGAACLSRFNGMFALAIWNQAEQALFLARDRLGVKPLYYTQHRDTILFASEIKALLQHPEVERQVDLTAVDSYMSFLWTPEPKTAFRGILKLESGHYAEWKNGTLVKRQYWNVSFDPDTTMRPAQWIDEVQERLRLSVKSRMISDVPLGAFLSGGVDSTTITHLMCSFTGRQISTYTIGFSDEDLKQDVIRSDVYFARLASQHMNVDYNEIIVNPKILDLLPKLIWHMDEPVADPAAVTTFLVCQASRNKLTVLLSGVGGDEIFAGYPRFLAMKVAETYRRLPQWARAQFATKIISKLPAGTFRTFRDAKKFVRSADLPFQERYLGYRTYFSETDKAELYHRDFAEALRSQHSQPLLEHERSFAEASGWDFLSQLLYVDLKTFLPCLNLMYTDKMSMAASVEVREPFLDYQLVELAARMPSSLKLKGLTRKFALKKVAERLIPRQIVYRRKAGFGAPIRAWLTGPLRELVLDVFSESTIKKRGYFNSASCQRLLREQETGQEYNANHLWQFLTLELWHRQFMGPHP